MTGKKGELEHGHLLTLTVDAFRELQGQHPRKFQLKVNPRSQGRG